MTPYILYLPFISDSIAEVFVDVDGEKYYARITRVLPPLKHLTNGSASTSTTNGTNGVKAPEAHAIGVDLRVPAEEALIQDDPMAYVYGVRLIEEPDHVSPDGQERPNNAYQAEKWSGNENEVNAAALRYVSFNRWRQFSLIASSLFGHSRDRLSFSKSILRRFIRDCVDRDAAVASPWTVKRVIAEQLGIATEIPEDIRKAIDGAKAGEKEKRKKVWEDKHEAEGIPPKKRKKEEGTGTLDPHTLSTAAESTSYRLPSSYSYASACRCETKA